MKKSINNVNFRKVQLFFVVVAFLLVSLWFTIGANAYSSSSSTPSNQPKFTQWSDNDNALKTEYGVGNALPFNDAYTYASAWAQMNKNRYVETKCVNIGADRNPVSHQSFNIMGGGSISIGQEILGHDEGIGHAIAYTYNSENQSSLATAMTLTVD